MVTRKSIPIRSDPKFKQMLDEIKLERIRSMKNETILSDRRLTLAMTRIPNLKNILLSREIKDE